ncbi:MFS transporter [Saccharomonospora xinjiangensis]|uniref:MFS transporter n=1 Tax=Saccharomonospora xinjiangensis TaxID=75294 RepID=UPI0010C2D326|nr:MFS transporter [Saccharomonospora xinjiangensis]QBQ61863.1 Purine ribonucleoside efflux pump NepI [Saccharomonospora xinjiangensis]
MTETQAAETLPSRGAERDGFPWSALLALAAAGFLAIFTETVPAGLLPQLSTGLGISEPAAGQLVTLYALGSVAAAIPLVAATRSMSRKKVLLTAVLGLAVLNTVTTVAPWYELILVARFAAGAAAALIWGVLAGYARRLVEPGLQGRALTVTGIGQPIALACGVPLGALAGSVVDWRWVFAALSVAAAFLALWIASAVPDVPGQPPANRIASPRVVLLPGIRPILLVALSWVLGHNILYTYAAPLLAPTGLRLDIGLAVFGVAAFLGITATGVVIDRALRATVLGVLALMAVASAGLTHPALGAVLIGVVVAVWGFSFGGAPALLQTALADRAGEHTDVAQSVFVTVFNLAVGGGGLLGGAILATSAPATALAWTALALSALAALAVGLCRKAFPPGRRGNPGEDEGP